MIKKKLIIFVLLFSAIAIQAQPTEINQTNSTDTLSVIQHIENWYSNNMNYYSITALMTIESSFIPFPSEIVVPPAAYVAGKPESKLNIFLVVLFATLGAILGALINYYLALWLGRPIIYKFADSKIGNLLLLSSDKIKKAEEYFNRRGKISTFVGRLIPGIRQLISIPAGLAGMNIFSFIFYTFLGALIWNSILAFIGYLAQGQSEIINEYSHELSLVIIVLLVLGIIYLTFNYFRKKE